MVKNLSTQDVVSAFLERLGAQDADGVASLFAETIDWYVPLNAALPWTGARSRRSDVSEYFRTLWPALEPGKSTVEMRKLVVSGDDAVLFLDFSHTAASTGRPFSTPVAMHLVVADGEITTMHLYEDTWAVGNAFRTDVAA